MLKNVYSTIFRNTWLDIPLRRLYYRIHGQRVRRSIDLNGTTVYFFSPSAQMTDSMTALNRERDILEQFLRELDEGDIFWDVGANMGLWALFSALKLRPGGRVVCFEPEPGVRKFLHRNVAANGLKNVHVLPQALDEKAEMARLLADEDDPSISRLPNLSEQSSPEWQGIEIECITGEEVVSRGLAPAPQVMKIDVEGAELKVLKGCGPRVWEPLRFLAIEVHPLLLANQGGSVEELEHLLAVQGFEKILSQARHTEFHWLCRKAASLTTWTV